MEEQKTRHDLTSQIAGILAKYVGNEKVVVKEEDKANIVTLRDDESLNIEVYDGALMVWLFSYENYITRDNDEEAIETVKWQLEEIFTKPIIRVKTYKANKLVKEVYKFDEYSSTTDYLHLLWRLLHWGKNREDTTIINYDAETGKFTETVQ